MLTLGITGIEDDLETVTEILGFDPTSFARKGQPSRSGKPHSSNGWWHEAGDRRLFDGGQHDDALARLLAHLHGREEHFAQLRVRVQPKRVTVYGDLYVPTDGQCGVWLEPRQMALLAACDIGWGLDLLVDD